MGFYKLFVFSCLLFAGVYFLFRKKKPIYTQRPKGSEEIIMAPASGVISNLYSRVCHDSNQQTLYIQIRVSLLSPYGLYLPFSSEVKKLEHYNGKPQLRYFDILQINTADRFNMVLDSKRGHRAKLIFVRCLLGLRPLLWVALGDRGCAGAAIGFFPFGGSVLISLPETSQVLVEKGQDVISGETVLAVL